jgi:hypothetical protein
MEKFDIQVTISVIAKDESDAETKTMLFLKEGSIVTGNKDILDWELTEFVPNELNASCCC